LRVAKKGIVVSFSNMHYWVYRLKYLLGRYPVNYQKFFPTSVIPCDRHKWIINCESAADFVKHNAGAGNIAVGYYIHNHRRFKPLNAIERFLSNFWPNLFVNSIIFYISK